jgi:hypothetical protein
MAPNRRSRRSATLPFKGAWNERDRFQTGPIWVDLGSHGSLQRGRPIVIGMSILLSG